MDLLEFIEPCCNLNRNLTRKGLRFAIREGGCTVGSGQVTEIVD